MMELSSIINCKYNNSFTLIVIIIVLTTTIVTTQVVDVQQVSSFHIQSSTTTSTSSAMYSTTNTNQGIRPTTGVLSCTLKPTFRKCSALLSVTDKSSSSSSTTSATTTNNVFPISIRQALIERSKRINSVGLLNDENNGDDKTIASSQTKGQYTTAGWSNRAATIVTPVYIPSSSIDSTNNNNNNNNIKEKDGAIYTIDRPFYWNNIDVGCRATIIELPFDTTNNNNNNNNNMNQKPDLLIHSPVGLDGPLIKCLQEIGTVKYIVSTNYEHTKFANMWYQQYCTNNNNNNNSNNNDEKKNTAYIWGCPGLMERMPHIQWTGEIPYGYRPISWKYNNNNNIEKSNTVLLPTDHTVWDTSILQPLHLNIEHNPFTQKAFFNEVIYYHAPSKALIITDMYWNYPTADGITNAQYKSIKERVYSNNNINNTVTDMDDVWELAPIIQPIPIGSTIWKFGMDQIYYNFYNNYMITDYNEYERIVDHIINVWDIQLIIPAHGDIIRGTRTYIQTILKDYFNKFITQQQQLQQE